jgi:hypothetical protein
MPPEGRSYEWDYYWRDDYWLTLIEREVGSFDPDLVVPFLRKRYGISRGDSASSSSCE